MNGEKKEWGEERRKNEWGEERLGRRKIGEKKEGKTGFVGMNGEKKEGSTGNEWGEERRIHWE